MDNINNNWQLECIGIKNKCAHILETGEFSDCTFLVGKEADQVRISGHKVILAMSSPVFQAMFYGSLPENNAEIPIIDIAANVFKSLLVYIYTDVIEIDSAEKACELFHAAQKYMLTHLTIECVAYLSSKLSASNVLKVFEFAKFNDNEDLMEQCIKVIQENAEEVLSDTSFTEVSLETVCTVFSMDPLNVDSELDLFEAAERYAEANKLCPHPPEDNKSITRAEIISLPENNQSGTSYTQPVENEGRSEATFSYTVHNVENLMNKALSPVFYVRNLPWQIKVKLGDASPKTLAVYLACNVGSKSACWSCYAAYTLEIICHKSGTQPFRRKSARLFHSKSRSWGWAKSIRWNDLLDPEKGYLKDESITITAQVIAEPPHGILGTTNNRADGKENLTIRHAVRLIRFLTLTAEQFAEGAANSSLLDESEENAIFINLLAKEPHVPMPDGFCDSKRSRTKI